MNHEDYVRASKHWEVKDSFNREEGLKMSDKDVMNAAEEYIVKNNTCTLATADGDFVRCTPIEYTYHDGAFWMFSEGGLKFKALENNKNVCLAIYDRYEGFGNLKGLQVTGTAVMPEYFSEEYNKAAKFKNIPIDMLKKLEEPMNLIKVIPQKIEFLNSDFKKAGYDSRQSVRLI